MLASIDKLIDRIASIHTTNNSIGPIPTWTPDDLARYFGMLTTSPYLSTTYNLPIPSRLSSL